MHPHGTARRWFARRVRRAQAGERRVEGVDAAHQEGASGHLAPPWVQQGAATGDGADHAGRPPVAQHAQEGGGEVLRPVGRVGLDELLPTVDEQQDRRRCSKCRRVARSLRPHQEAPVHLGAQVLHEGGAGPHVVDPGAGSQVREGAEVGQRPVTVDDVQVQ